MAASQSHSGKTTVTLAVMAALRAAGWGVAPFKAGPDFIDPLWHAVVCQRPSYSLDTVMVGAMASRTLLKQHCREGEVAVVEGVMGLYDGREGVGGPGSTAALAAALEMPVLLVVDARGMAGSIVPLVAGFVQYAKEFKLAGVLANRVGSTRHARILQQALQDHDLPPLLGWLAQTPAIGLGNRHLGLLLPWDQAVPTTSALLAALTLDMDRLWEVASAGCEGGTRNPALQPTGARLIGKRVAVARDQAFCFIYPANLDWLQDQGATVLFFSPLAGEPLPEGSDALWLPGGYPELHAEALSVSSTWPGIRQICGAGLPVLAECGGMMALGDTLTDHAGRCWPMAGVLPIHTRMTERLAGLGYRQDHSGVRGHEFHHSVRDSSTLTPAFRLKRGDNGVRWMQVRASYVHWYFPSQPDQSARWFLNSTKLEPDNPPSQQQA
ncbi:MAG: cobyrinate a,c-diamide synthase [Magnetococcus sp. DMHC-8]